MSNTFTHREKQEGIALLITLLLMGVLASIGASLMNITLKQYQFSGLALASEVAFQAANAGMECVVYHDFNTDMDPVTGGIQGPFDVTGNGTEQLSAPTISCMGATYTSDDNSNGTIIDPNIGNHRTVSGGEQRFLFDFGTNPTICSEVSVYKFYNTSVSVPVIINGVNMWKGGVDCPVGGTCTVVQARGYNVSCAEVNAGANPRIVEREYTQVY